jgi:hypothetical protein
MRSVRNRLTYANVMATLAVFGVLAGGGAYAASKIGAGGIKRNAIHAKHIHRGAVETPKLARRAVTPAKAKGLVEGIANGSLTVSVGGGAPPVLDVPGFGQIQGGCGSGGGGGGGGLRLFNQSGLTLHVASSGPGTGVVEDVADGASSTFTGPAVGAPGVHLIQASRGSGTDSRVMTVLGTATASASGPCKLQVQVISGRP